MEIASDISVEYARWRLDIPILEVDVEFAFLKYLKEKVFVVCACCRKQTFVYWIRAESDRRGLVVIQAIQRTV